MNKHTPGEWLRDGRTVYALNSDGFNRMTVSVMPAISNNGSTPEEQEANARLIAASPMLLEALKSALATAEFERHPNRPWQHEARAAIAAAEGKEGA